MKINSKSYINFVKYLFLVCISWGNAQAQPLQKAVFLPSQNTSVQSNKPYKGLLGFYKNYISSQDGESCSFEPSCSVYSSQCFKKHNFFYALFLTSDRLTRCNGHSHFYLKGKLSKPMDKP